MAPAALNIRVPRTDYQLLKTKYDKTEYAEAETYAL